MLYDSKQVTCVQFTSRKALVSGGLPTVVDGIASGHRPSSPGRGIAITNAT
ncbi:unnamed protein product [Nippostrongylus brasiliensis]|uniref:Lipoprotein n=1 Tax=Nippostrongylus brasiliensis TaxID=27835 RepID=A0A0N4YUT6_NIPBR|nr:unnamed protein product [Nippostrongylus brasiliensis]